MAHKFAISLQEAIRGRTVACFPQLPGLSRRTPDWRSFMGALTVAFGIPASGGLTYIAEEKNGRADHKMDHLACFVGLVFALHRAGQLPFVANSAFCKGRLSA